MAASFTSYEEVARHLLNEFSERFGLQRVEAKQKIPGKRSGTTWELDAKGVLANGTAFLIIECRRYTRSRQKQGQIGELAYRIKDTGAAGAILVSPLGFQEGAQRIAAAERITEVTLKADCTTTDYVLNFLKETIAGGSLTASAQMGMTFEAVVKTNKP